MPIDNGVLLLLYDQHPRPGMGLGRNMELDARSLGFLAKPEPVIEPKEWLPAITTLNQGDLGSCVGNASTYHLSNWYGANLSAADLLSEGETFTLTADDADHNEKYAVEVYHLASEADRVPGNYPPVDTGSTGLAACKQMKEHKLITSYVWATDAIGIASLFQTRGMIVGVPWFNDWFTPDMYGFVDSGDWRASGSAGGHEIYFEALEVWDATDMSRCIVRFHNSWGQTWGDHGCGRMRLSTYETLQSQIDVKQFRLG